MSTTLKSTPITVQQRGAEATARLREVLGLDDIKLLGTALAEVAIDEASRDPGFANRVRAIYQELVDLKAARPSRPRKSVSDEVELVPLIKIEGRRIDPFGPLDPYFLFEVYGAAQLRAALSGYPLARLKEAAEMVEQRTGIKPKGRATKASITDYIVEHVAGSK